MYSHANFDLHPIKNWPSWAEKAVQANSFFAGVTYPIGFSGHGDVFAPQEAGVIYTVLPFTFSYPRDQRNVQLDTD